MKENYNSTEDGNQTIMAKLAKKTKHRHQELSSLPFFNALIDHKLPLDSYVNQLRVLAVIHAVLEQEIESTDNKFVTSVWSKDMQKFNLLQDDLQFFEPRTLRDSIAALDEAYEFTRMIRQIRIENPKMLLGIVYVFEGTTLGNDMHRNDVINTFKLFDNYGSKYYTSYGHEVHTHWDVFKNKMDKTLSNADDHEQMLSTVFKVFDALEKIYLKLYPLDRKGLSSHVARINPLAGNHPIPEDDREIDAALKASNIAWKEFPYYENRFGERGKLFSDSDICWLATLVGLNQKKIDHQIRWFSTVLASRGMPTILLEKTLVWLGDELIEANQAKKADYQKLISKGNEMKKRRQQKLDELQLKSAIDDFYSKIDEPLATKHPDAGLLMAGAVYDDACGVTEAIPSFLAWAHDETTFPKNWIKASEILMDKVKLLLNN